MERDNVHEKPTRTWCWRWNGRYKLLYLSIKGWLIDKLMSFFLQPNGFDVGPSEKGNVLKGLDLGVEGMRVGANERLYINSKVCFDIQRLVIVPPELAYGKKGVQGM